jgi:hypothetical protein
MTVKLSVAVMAHRKRAELVPKLCKRLGVGMDRVVWDQFNDRWDTGRRSLLAYDEDVTHHLVVQDDAVPARDLISSIESWIPKLPHGVLCLYAGRVKEFRLVLQKQRPPQPSWLQMRKINWGVALVFPVEHIRPAVAYGDRRVEMENYDMRLSEYCVLNNVPVLYPYPSWVNHETTPSLVPGRGAHRKAHLALNQSQSVRQWDRGRRANVVPIPDFVRQSELAYPLLSTTIVRPAS